MKIGVIGGGSIGLLLSSYLAEKHQVTVYVRREEQKSVINKRGLSLAGSSSNYYYVKAAMIGELNTEDCLFICVKQTHIKDVIDVINRTNSQTPLFFLQNGMGHLEKFEQLTQTIYVGVVEHGAYRKDDRTVIHTGIGEIKIAVFKGRTNELNSLIKKLSRRNFPINYHRNWQELLKKKLIINAVINPLTALFNVKNGEILENKYILYLARALCAEAATILGLDFQGEWDRVQAIAMNTAENTSSMLADLKRKTKTENDAISGFLINTSKNTPPYTAFIYHSIKALEVRNGI